MLKYKYVPPEKENNLKTYRYIGGDNSYVYAYILSPIANFCVNYLVPEWLAPNLITLLGFLCILIPHFIVFGMFPDKLEGDVPIWLCLILGVLHLVYMNFDNMDGKQARKTGNSSPLGLLFDHGCDSLVIMLQGLSLSTVLQFGNSYQSLVVYLIGCLPFFFTTLEEYYTNALILPVINGPCEGCLTIGMFFLITAINGCNYWNENDFLIPIARKNLLFIAFSIFSFLNVSFNFYQMYTKIKDKGSFKESLYKMSFYIYLISSIAFVFFFSPSGISQRQARNLIYLLGLNFGKLVTHLQIAHVSGSNFVQFRRTTFLIFTSLNINTIFGLAYGTTPVNEDTMLYFLLLISIFAYVHLVVNVIVQFTEVLKIKCFKVKGKIEEKTQ